MIALWFGETRPRDPRLHPGRRQTGARRRAAPSIPTRAALPPLREAIRDFHRRTPGAEIGARADHGSRCGHAGRDHGAAVRGGDRRQYRRRLARLAEHFPGGGNLRRRSSLCAAGRRLERVRRRAGTSISRSCSRSATRAPRRSSSPRPAIPTGWIMTRDEQRAVLDFARARGIAIISDEVYGTLVYRRQRACAVVPADRRTRRRGVRDQLVSRNPGR